MAIRYKLSCGHKTRTGYPPTVLTKYGWSRVAEVGDTVRCSQCKSDAMVVEDVSDTENPMPDSYPRYHGSLPERTRHTGPGGGLGHIYQVWTGEDDD